MMATVCASPADTLNVFALLEPTKTCVSDVAVRVDASANVAVTVKRNPYAPGAVPTKDALGVLAFDNVTAAPLVCVHA